VIELTAPAVSRVTYRLCVTEGAVPPFDRVLPEFCDTLRQSTATSEGGCPR